MSNKVKTPFIIFCLILIVLTRSEPGMDTAAENPICPAPGEISLEVQSSQPPLQFDYSSFVWDPLTDDSIPLYTKNGDDTNDFSMILFDNKFKQYIQRPCVGTAGFAFVDLLNNLLIVQDQDDNKYYACNFHLDQTVDVLPTQLLLPESSRITGVTRFNAFYFYDQAYFVVGNDGQATIEKYNIPSVNDANPTPITPTAVGNKFQNNELKQVFGTTQFIYDAQTNTAFGYDSQSLNWESPQTNPITDGRNWYVAALAENYAAIAELSNDKTQGRVIVFKKIDLMIMEQDLPTSTTPYALQTEQVSNAIVYADDYFYWFNVDFQGNQRAISLQNGQIETQGLNSISLSSNKLITLYDDQINYYQMVWQGDKGKIQLIMSKTFDTQIEEVGQYRFGLLCLCQRASKFACYSSTLNCLIIKQAKKECGRQDIPV